MTSYYFLEFYFIKIHPILHEEAIFATLYDFLSRACKEQKYLIGTVG